MWRLSLFLYLFPAALFPAALFAANPSIESLTASSADGRVTVRLSLANAFQNPQTIQALQSGIPTGFTYVIEIYRDRPNWFDEGIDRSRIEVIATFNSVTREYLLNYRRDKKLVRSETFSDLPTLEKRMSTIDEPDLFEIGKRKPYKLKVRAKADFMHDWLLYFIPREMSTRWRDARVTVAEVPKP
ncbi:MAG TPA: DUF4390 domain-containing protein [Thermoanaerobaculia bacterium]|nr:DUF4390 domain-containing protein [Thermoanaerobaculia bacterium]